MSNTVMEKSSNLVEQFQTTFNDLMLTGGFPGPRWLDQRRQQAWSHFQQLGLPSRRNENWRFTPIKPLTEHVFQLANELSPSAVALDSDSFPQVLQAEDVLRLVFFDGHLVLELSDLQRTTPGVEIDGLARMVAREPQRALPWLTQLADMENNAFVALNSALFQDGGYIHFRPDGSAHPTVELIFISSGTEATATFPRIVIHADTHSRGRVVQRFLSLDEGPCFTCPVTEISVDAEASIEHAIFQQENQLGIHVGHLAATLQSGSQLLSHVVAQGCRLSRQEITAQLLAPTAHLGLFGLYMGRDEQLFDHQTEIEHAAPHCTSDEIYKGILNDKSHGVFRGKIHVHPDAQKTDAKQSNRAVLLSDRAQINTMPQLEIYADDVKCTHGATVGQLDDEALFYLRSRGLNLESARALLIRGFAQEMLDRLENFPFADGFIDQLIANGFGATS